MATRVIGLDIGTHAVRAVEISIGRGQPVIEKMGQVALPAGTVVAGEVTDPAGVSAALRRLWRDVAFSSREVVVGVANARVVARMTEMPSLPEAELRSSLPYQVQELIPIPVAEAQLDFQITEHFVNDEGENRVKLMLVAAQRDMLRTLLASVTGAGLRVARVDLVALALIRALYSPDDWLVSASLDDTDEAPVARPPLGPEVIIGVGAGVTNVVVHQGGIPSFIRTVPSGGNAVTEALAIEMGIGAYEAEGLKRGGAFESAPGAEDDARPAHGDLQDDGTDEPPSRRDVALATREAVEPVVGEVVGSLDFHRSSTEGGRVRRVVLSGGGSRLPVLRSSLADQLGVPVELGDPYRGVRVGKIGIEPALVAASADLFTVALGLALSGAALEGDGSRISLLPAEIQAQRDERQHAILAGAGVGLLALALVGAGVWRGSQAGQIRTETAAIERSTNLTQGKITNLASVATLETDVAADRVLVTVAAQGDVSWPTLVQKISNALPADVFLSSLAGARATTAGGASSVNMSGSAADQASVSAFLIAMKGVDAIKDVWLGSATRADESAPVTFTATATLAPGAESGIAKQLGGTK